MIVTIFFPSNRGKAFVLNYRKQSKSIQRHYPYCGYGRIDKNEETRQLSYSYSVPPVELKQNTSARQRHYNARLQLASLAMLSQGYYKI